MSEGNRLTMTTPTDLTIEMKRSLAAPRELVFEAWTNPEHVPHWLMGPENWTMTVCEIDLRPGGRWHYAWRHANGAELEMSGEYREVERPARIVNTEKWGGEWPETINTLELTEEDGGTLITQTMLFPTKEARDAVANGGMEGGVARSFDLLDEYLATLV